MTNVQKHTADMAEGLASTPFGGVVKMWFLGIAIALLPVAYGVHYCFSGHARFWGSRFSSLELDGPAALSLAIAYIAVGVFMHFHWFWGLHSRLLQYSPLLKAVALLLFIGSFGYTIYRVFA